MSTQKGWFCSRQKPIAGKFAGEELQPVSISDAGIPGIPAVIRVVFIEEDF
jgi:hypothetical protein